ncbi:MAG: response regulator transcription factor [Verrucomicrobia bacterium]|jgi:two-component system, NarL family, invasion response regulator UvrY|nr:response regulator transcription factor [Verrucomicrobiota bacterium]
MGDTGILIVDDHELLRQGLKALILSEPSLSVVGEAASGEDALDLYLGVCPDIVLMDVNMPGIGGVETTRRILQKDTRARIVGLSMHVDSVTTTAMREAGCLGFVSKSAPFEELVFAIRAASTGIAFPHDEAAHAGPTAVQAGNDVGLTRHEQELLALIGRGLSNEELAKRLDVSVSTVNIHRRRIMSKLRPHSQ